MWHSTLRPYSSINVYPYQFVHVLWVVFDMSIEVQFYAKRANKAKKKSSQMRSHESVNKIDIFMFTSQSAFRIQPSS